MRPEDLVAAIHDTLEGRRGLVQFAPHPDVLGTLSCEEERDVRRAQVSNLAAHYIGSCLASYKCVQPGPYFLGIVA